MKDSTNIDLDYLRTDPWGSPYLMDENEGEISTNLCRSDIVFSPGPNKINQNGGSDDVAKITSFFLDECK